MTQHSTAERIPSYEKINYRLRPAKSIERKMLCESFRKLAYFSPINKYRYIGFGSPFFADYILFHKQLGIENMISIEKDYVNQERFEYNKPYRCIEMRYGTSNVELPGINWEESRDIVWLDYDGHLDTDVLEDIQTVFYRVSSGSIVTLTVNVNYRPGAGGFALFSKCLGDKMPENLEMSDIQHWKAAEVCKNIILEEINKTINNRNGLQDEGEKYFFEQLYYLGYSDGAKMLTFGGIVFNEKDKPKFESCNFNELYFIKQANDMHLIDVPSLTYKEIRNLDSQLPSQYIEHLNSPGVKAEDIKRYSNLYKYFPAFSETEI